MRCCVVALGGRTPVGIRADSSALAVHAGISRVAEHPFMVDSHGNPFMVAMDRTYESYRRRERLVHLASSALSEVVETLPLAANDPLTVYLGLPEYGPFFSEADGAHLCGQLSRDASIRADLRFLPIADGHASGVVAMERAVFGLESRMFSCCIVGGVDSWLDADLLETLDRDRRLISEHTRWGFSPGEGAAMLAVCTFDFARQAGLPILAWVASASSAVEPHHMHTQTVCTGEGLGAVMKAVSARAGAPITRQYCDINGERYREHEFSYAILRVPHGAFVDAVDYVAPADAWGNCGAASAPMLSLLPLVTHAHGFSPGPWPMVWSSSESGRRGAMVFHLGSGAS